MADSELLYEVKDRIATITLNRPDKMNAFTGPMIDRWSASLNEAQADPNVNVVIVTGAGKAFCSGGDVNTFKDGVEDDSIDLPAQVRRGAEALHMAIVDLQLQHGVTVRPMEMVRQVEGQLRPIHEDTSARPGARTAPPADGGGFAAVGTESAAPD